MDCLPHIHAVAIHAPPSPEYRTSVPGLGALCRDGDRVLGAGGYNNSNGDFSKYVAVGVQPWRAAGLRIGGIVGTVDGYKSGHAEPLAAALLSAPVRWGEIHAIISPPFGDKPLAVEFGATIRFNHS